MNNLVKTLHIEGMDCNTTTSQFALMPTITEYLFRECRKRNDLAVQIGDYFTTMNTITLVGIRERKVSYLEKDNYIEIEYVGNNRYESTTQKIIDLNKADRDNMLVPIGPANRTTLSITFQTPKTSPTVILEFYEDIGQSLVFAVISSNEQKDLDMFAEIFNTFVKEINSRRIINSECIITETKLPPFVVKDFILQRNMDLNI